MDNEPVELYDEFKHGPRPDEFWVPLGGSAEKFGQPVVNNGVLLCSKNKEKIDGLCKAFTQGAFGEMTWGTSGPWTFEELLSTFEPLQAVVLDFSIANSGPFGMSVNKAIVIPVEGTAGDGGFEECGAD